MKKIILWLLAFIPAIVSYAGDGDKHISVNAGILAPYTLDATIGYEHPIGYGHAFEVYAEAGNHWQTPVCHRFWKGYFWDGGIIYKHRISRFKNGRLRAVGGLQCGLDRQKIFFGVELGMEYNYIFPNSWEFSIRQKNTVNFLHGDIFRCGLMLGVKIPL